MALQHDHVALAHHGVLHGLAAHLVGFQARLPARDVLHQQVRMDGQRALARQAARVASCGASAAKDRRPFWPDSRSSGRAEAA